MPMENPLSEMSEGKLPDESKVWDAVVLFAGYPFETMKGLKFEYSVKKDEEGKTSGELFVNRKEKSITKSSVEMAYRKVLEMGDGKLPVSVSGPKKLGVFGASYLYPVFIKLGIIEKGERKRKMKIEDENRR